MTRLTQIEPASASGEAKALLDAVEAKLGSTPNVLRTLAASPASLKAYLSLSESLDTGRFTAKEREAIALTTAGANYCEYCASAHTAVSKNLRVDADEITRRLAGHSNDPRLDAVLTFAYKIVDTRGYVSDGDLEVVRQQGLDDGDILEIITNVVANILTNYVNHVAQTEIDFPKVELKRAHAA